MADLPFPVQRPEPGQDPSGPRGSGQTAAAPPHAVMSLLALATVVVLASLMLASLLGLGGIGLGLAVRGVHVSTQPLRIPRLPQRSTIYAADGSVLGSVYLNFNREVVPLSRVNHITREAVLAIEDHRFYAGGPLDLRSIVRALVANLRAGAIVQGGSTIAQQLVKDTITGDRVSISRKIREAFYAIRLERTYSKDHILQMYLNEVYLGNGVYGIAAAAGFYFGQTVRHLSLPQAEVLGRTRLRGPPDRLPG